MLFGKLLHFLAIISSSSPNAAIHYPWPATMETNRTVIHIKPGRTPAYIHIEREPDSGPVADHRENG